MSPPRQRSESPDPASSVLGDAQELIAETLFALVYPSGDMDVSEILRCLYLSTRISPYKLPLDISGSRMG